MTPPPVTVAGRGAGEKRSTSGPGNGSGESVRGRRRAVGQGSARKPPRRLSGPLTGRLGADRPPAQRRVAAPARSQLRRPAQPRTRPAAQLGARAVRFVRGLPDHRMLDRLIRGRVWIPLLGVMLAGIVAMQVEVLKLGASIGRSVERTATLQTSNEALQEEVATLGGDRRIEALAAMEGMVMQATGGVGFLAAGGGADVGRAIANIHAPNTSAFLSLASTNGAIATGLNATAGATSGSGTPALGTGATTTAASSQTQPATTAVPAATTTPVQTAAPPTGAATTGAATPTQTATPTNSSGAGAGVAPGTTGSGSSQTPVGGATPTSAGSSPTSAGSSPTSAGSTSTGPSQTGASSTGGAGIPVGG